MRVAVGCVLLMFSSAVYLAAQARASSAESEVAPDTLITLQRFACEDHCAVYRLVIFADGSVIYDGKYFVRRTGLVMSSIGPKILAKLVRDLDTGRFFELENDYGFQNKRHCDSTEAGGPLAILSVSNAGRSRTVIHQHTCTGPDSERVTGLEDLVDHAVNAAKWIK